MKESISSPYPTALEAAAAERRLQLESAIQFDLHEYRIGDQVTWQVPHEGIGGRGELTEIGDPIEIERDGDKHRLKWEGSLYVQLLITESSILRPKRRMTGRNTNAATPVPDRYVPGRCIELKKNQIIGRTRKRVD